MSIEEGKTEAVPTETKVEGYVFFAIKVSDIEKKIYQKGSDKSVLVAEITKDDPMFLLFSTDDARKTTE